MLAHTELDEWGLSLVSKISASLKSAFPASLDSIFILVHSTKGAWISKTWPRRAFFPINLSISVFPHPHSHWSNKGSIVQMNRLVFGNMVLDEFDSLVRACACVLERFNYWLKVSKSRPKQNRHTIFIMIWRDSENTPHKILRSLLILLVLKMFKTGGGLNLGCRFILIRCSILLNPSVYFVLNCGLSIPLPFCRFPYALFLSLSVKISYCSFFFFLYQWSFFFLLSLKLWIKKRQGKWRATKHYNRYWRYI